MEYINCEWCGITIKKKNRLHRHCSSKCRKKAWRKRNGKKEYPSFLEPRITNFENVTRLKPTYNVVKENISPSIAPISYPAPASPDISDSPKRDKRKIKKKGKSNINNKFDELLDKEMSKQLDIMKEEGYTKSEIKSYLYENYEAYRPLIHKALQKTSKITNSSFLRKELRKQIADLIKEDELILIHRYIA